MSLADYRTTSPISRRVGLAVLAKLVQTIEEFVLNSLCLMESINAKYVSQKISKIRWKPVSHAALQQPDIFVTGSWDNEVGKFCFMLVRSARLH